MKYIVLILATLFLAGCGKEVVPPDAAATLGTLSHIGKIIGGIAVPIVYTGTAIASLAAIALLLTGIPAVFALLSAIPFIGGKIRTFLLDAIAGGILAILVGTSDLWVADHTWVLVVAIFAGLGYLLVRFHSNIFTPAVIATVEKDTHVVMADLGWAWNKFTGLWHHSSGITVAPTFAGVPVTPTAVLTGATPPVTKA